MNGKRTDRIHLIRTAFAEDCREASFWLQGESSKQTFVLSEAEKIGRWLTNFFDFTVRFVNQPINGFPDDRVASGPTIVSEESLQEIVRWFPGLTLEGARRRFRSNLEIGTADPFWEDCLFGAPEELRPSGLGTSPSWVIILVSDASFLLAIPRAAFSPCRIFKRLLWHSGRNFSLPGPILPGLITIIGSR